MFLHEMRPKGKTISHGRVVKITSAPGRGWAALLGALYFAALVAVTPATGQPRGEAAARPDYRGTGVVLALLPPPSALHSTRPVIVIEHDAIAGLMNEHMSMPFIAASTTLFDGLAPGDRIAFGLKDTPGALLVIVIERLPPRR